MPESLVFHYRPTCTTPGCSQPAVFKAGAVWSDGTSRELKNYGLACETHREGLMARARQRRDQLRLADGESVGPVALYVLEQGRRDTALSQA